MSKAKYQQWRLQVLAQARRQRQHLSQQLEEVEAPEEEVSAGAIEAAVGVVVKVNRKPVRVCQRDHAHNTSVMGEKLITV